MKAFNSETYALFQTYLETHRAELRVTDLNLAAFVCVTSIEALTHTAVGAPGGRADGRGRGDAGG